MKASRLIRSEFALRIKPSGDLAADPGVAFNSFGTSPILNQLDGSESHLRLKVTSGSGVPAIAANNIVITFAQNPTKVWMCVRGTTTPLFYAAVSGATVTIGSSVAPVLSTAYDFELLVEF